MRYPTFILFVVLVLAGCSKARVQSSQSQAVSSPTQVPASQQQKTSIDSVQEFLITSAATDFRTHPPNPVRFREVRMGHVTSPNGELSYRLCGEFLPAEQGGKAEWIAFATIKTSPYEQWIGGQAAS